MSDFQAFNAGTHPIIKLTEDWNNLLDHGLIKGVNYIIRANGLIYEAIDGSTGKKYTSGASAATVINATLANLTVGRTWNETVLLKGPIEINDTLKMPIYTHLIVDGSIKLANNTNKNMLEYLNPNYGKFIEIEGGYWDGNKTNNASGNGIYLNNSNYILFGSYDPTIRLHDFRMIDIPETGMVLLGDHSGSWITRVVVHSAGKDGLELSSNDCMITDSIFGNCGYRGVYLHGQVLGGVNQAGGNMFTQCKVFGCGQLGADVNNTTDGWYNYNGNWNVFQGCWSQMNARHGFHFYGPITNKCTINGCTANINSWPLKATGKGIIFDDCESDHIISNNSVFDTQTPLSGGGISIINTQRVLISNNSITSIKDDMIDIESGSNHCKIENNLLMGNDHASAQNCIHIQDTFYLTLNGNTLMNSGVGIRETGTSTYNQVVGGLIHLCDTPITAVALKVRNIAGFDNEALGTATILKTNTSIQASHGLPRRPDMLLITPSSNLNADTVDKSSWGAVDVGNTTLTISISPASATDNYTFYWKAWFDVVIT